MLDMQRSAALATVALFIVHLCVIVKEIFISISQRHETNDLLSMSLNIKYGPFHFKLHSKFQKMMCKSFDPAPANILYRYFICFHCLL